jgi:hypothetical protein
MAYNGVVFAGGLVDINTACAGSLLVLKPLLANVDQSLFGPLGIGALRDNLQLQMNAAISASAHISLNIVNPLAAFQQALISIKQLEANLIRALALGSIPSASIQATTQVSALAKVAASIGVQLGNLLALIQALLNSKIPAASFAGSLAEHLSAGDAFLLSFEDVPMNVVGGNISGSFSVPLSYGPAVILPGEHVYGLVILTKVPSTWTAIQAILRT